MRQKPDSGRNVPVTVRQPSRWTSLWISLLLAACTLAVYWPVTGYQFVSYDDSDFVTANPIVQAGLTVKGFKWVWHSEVARNWHPITMLSHMMDCQLFGVAPGWHHLTNLLLHIANTLLLFHLLKMLTGAVWRSAIIASLFALHPLHVESVAWIAERKDVLSTLFWFLTTWAYVRYTISKSKALYALTLFLFALGLMSKPMLVTVPFFLLLLDYWPLRRMEKAKERPGLILEKIPFVAMSAALCVITFEIQKQGGAMLTSLNLPFASRLENALISYVRYIGKMFWPHHLAGLYLRSDEWPLWQVSLAALFLIAVSILVVRERVRRPYLAVGWFWYLGTLVPVIGIVQVGMQSMADRFTYVPLIGLFIMVVWGAAEGCQRWRLPNFVPAAISILLLTTCADLTARQVTYWRDSETLFTRMITATSNNYMAHYNLANVYSREKKTDQAMTNYLAALEEEPNYADADNNLGVLLLDQKRYEEALAHYTDAVRISPDYIHYFNLANALADAASARHDSNEFAQAVQTYQRALELNPSASEAYQNLGLTWQAQGRDSEAIGAFEQAVRLNPDFEAAQSSLANALTRAGKLVEASEHYLAVVRLDPSRVESYNDLGICYAMQNKMADAEQQFKQVIRLQPSNAAAFGNLGNALAAQNKIDEAIPYYLGALKLNPNDYQTEFNLGLSLSRQGKRAGAETHYRNALKLNPNYPEAQRALKELENGGKN
jgi:tetratricopeptide (TPR) repeat protein